MGKTTAEKIFEAHLVARGAIGYEVAVLRPARLAEHMNFDSVAIRSLVQGAVKSIAHDDGGEDFRRAGEREPALLLTHLNEGEVARAAAHVDDQDHVARVHLFAPAKCDGWRTIVGEANWEPADE